MKLAVSLLLILICSQCSVAQTSLEAMKLEHGKNSVGFRHYLLTDSTRTYQRIFDWSARILPRPVPVSVWYPTEQVKKQVPMSILEYMEVLKEEEEWEYLPNDQLLNWFYYSNTVANQAHLREKATAYKNAAPASGTYPVIIYAPSYQASSIENFALCEYLASFGYIVFSSPSRGTENRFLEGGTNSDMETQARDIEFLISKATAMPQADPSRIATMGFSFGGLSNIVSQMRNKNIKAVVSLDGSIKYKFNTLKASPNYDINKVNVPFIHFSQKDIPDEVLKADKIDGSLNTDFEFYDSLNYSAAYRIQLHHLTHAYFSTLGVLFQERDTRQDKSDAEIMASYKLVSRYTRSFLDAYIKGDSSSLQLLQNAATAYGSANNLLSIEFKEPRKKAFSFQQFNDLAARRKYENLKLLYDSLLQNNVSLELPEGNLNNLGLQLAFNPSTSRYAVQVFLLAIELYPGSGNLHDSLGEVYLYLKDTKNAIGSFEKSLVLSPENQNAIERLKQLKK